MALNIASGALLSPTSLATSCVPAAALTSISDADVKAKVKDLSSQVNALHTTVTGFASQGKAGTLPEALTLYKECYALIVNIDSTTNIVKVVKPSPVSESDGKAIYEQLSALEPAIKTGLAALQEKKPVFMTLMPQLLIVPGHPRDVVYATLVTLKTSFINLRLALIAAAPAAVKRKLLDKESRRRFQLPLLFTGLDQSGCISGMT